MNLPAHHGRSIGGFTLVELLAALAIMGVVALEAVPMVQSILDAQNLQAGSQVVRNELELARQNAVTKNRPVECRLYALNNGYYALGAVYDGTETPVTKIVPLPSNVIITNNEAFSTLQQATGTSSSTDSRGRKYLAFRFRADGSTPLDPASTYTMTLFVAKNGEPTTQLPVNFVTLQMDPVTGKTKAFQP